MPKTLLLCLFLLGTSCCIQAQDLHQTDYRLNPLLLNPSNTGAYAGSIRIGGVYRDQFRSFIDQAWQSPAVYVDSPIMKGLRKNDWIGVGMLLFTDRVGIAGLTSSGAYLSAAYHLGLDKRNRQLISIGFQYGQVRRSVNDASSTVFADELQNVTNISPDKDYFDQYAHSYSDLSFGVKYLAQVTKKSTLQIGATAAHLLLPQEVDDFLNMRINLHANYRYQYSKQLDFEPIFYFNSIKTSTTVSAQWMAHYRLQDENKTVLRAGVGYRSKDAIQILTGAIVKGWDIGLAFDLTVSKAASPTSGFGGFELGASKIINIYKTPEIEPRILCPRF